LAEYRNGRFINNIFVPEGTEVTLPEYTVQSHLTQENRWVVSP
jgi:phage tail protein X